MQRDDDLGGPVRLTTNQQGEITAAAPRGRHRALEVRRAGMQPGVEAGGRHRRRLLGGAGSAGVRRGRGHRRGRMALGPGWVARRRLGRHVDPRRSHRRPAARDRSGHGCAPMGAADARVRSRRGPLGHPDQRGDADHHQQDGAQAALALTGSVLASQHHARSRAVPRDNGGWLPSRSSTSPVTPLPRSATTGRAGTADGPGARVPWVAAAAVLVVVGAVTASPTQLIAGRGSGPDVGLVEMDLAQPPTRPLADRDPHRCRRVRRGRPRAAQPATARDRPHRRRDRSGGRHAGLGVRRRELLVPVGVTDGVRASVGAPEAVLDVVDLDDGSRNSRPYPGAIAAIAVEQRARCRRQDRRAHGSRWCCSTVTARRCGRSTSTRPTRRSSRCGPSPMSQATSCGSRPRRPSGSSSPRAG